MWCFVVLCDVMLCYVMLCYVMLCYVMLCYVTSSYIILLHIRQCVFIHNVCLSQYLHIHYVLMITYLSPN
jgi:hypothetical protein